MIIEITGFLWQNQLFSDKDVKPNLKPAKRVQVGKEERRSSDEKTDSSDELSVFERSGLSSNVARRKGFEPLTFWSVARRSIQLS